MKKKKRNEVRHLNKNDGGDKIRKFIMTFPNLH